MEQELFRAVRTGDHERVQALLEQDSALANKENGEGLTPLGYAAHFGQAGVSRLLLEHGAEVNALSHSKVSYIPSNTALHAAIAGERNPDVIRLLLEHGAEPNLTDSNGHSCLHGAAFHSDNPDLIRLLLEHGAQADASTSDGRTALAIAEEQGHVRVSELLRSL